MADNNKTRSDFNPGNQDLKKTTVGDVQTNKADKTKTKFSDVGSSDSVETTSESPLTGMLISFSNKDNGEFWPLYQGRNVLGRSSSCGVVLSEKTISSEHAIININRFENNEDLHCILTDLNSENGTKLDDKGLIRPNTGYDIQDRSRIILGEYELLFILIDKDKEGLKVNKKFKSMKGENSSESLDYSSQNYQSKNTRMG